MSISMDLITQLPMVWGYNGIMVVFYHFSKYSTLFSKNISCEANKTAEIFFKHIMNYYGLPLSIVSDKDPHFT